MNRREMFEAEKKRLDEEKSNKNRPSFEYDQVDYAPLDKDSVRVFRFFGGTVASRKNNFDPKIVYLSKIKDDKGKQFSCRWKDDPDWILNRIYSAVTAYTWDKDAVRDDGKKGKRIYKYVDLYPKMLDRVLHNCEAGFRYNGKIIENPGWKSKPTVYMNVISRDDYKWHVENKSFKLIAKKVSESENSKGEKTLYYEPGIPESLYSLLLDTVVEENGDWEDFDIAIKKIGEMPYYKCYSTLDERKLDKEDHVKMSDKPLTEEERSWKTFDIDKITPITTYKKIQNRLGLFIKEVDKNLETNFSEELDSFVEVEKVERDKLKESEKDDINSSDLEDKVEDTPDENLPPKKEVKRERKAREAREVKEEKPAEDADFWKNASSSVIKALDRLEEESSDFVSNIVDNKIIYQDADGSVVDSTNPDIIPCPTCKKDTYLKIPYCPYCGTPFTD